MSQLEATAADPVIPGVARARWYFVVLVLLVGACAASIPSQTLVANPNPAAVSDDNWVPPFEEHARCTPVLPPKPLETPLPAFAKAGRASLKVRFVIGTDGRLHKLAVVNSAGHMADSKAVNALRHWRYEPATCNGVPMEAEGTVEFPVR